MPSNQLPVSIAEAPFWGAGPVQFFQQLPVPVGVLLGPALVYQQVNTAYQQLFPGRELVGRPWAEAVPELTAHALAQRLRTVYETGQPLTDPEAIAVPGPAGQPLRYLRFSAQARHNAAGQVDGVVVVAAEAAGPEPAEAQQLALAHAQLAEGLAQIPAMVALLYGPEHRIEFVNPALQALFPERQLVGLPYAEALPEAYAQGYGAWLNQVYSTGETVMAYDTLLRFRNAQGQEQESYFDFTYSAYGQEATQGTVILAFDATERVKARQERTTRQQQLLAIFEQAPVALALLHGPEYVVEMANPSICAMWGRSLAEVASRSLFEVLPEIAAQGYKELLDGVRQTGKPYVAYQQGVSLLRAGRTEVVYFDFVYQSLFDAQGQVDSIAIVATNVTAVVVARQQAQQLSQEVARLNQELAAYRQAPS
jgi:PAS domain-containing protein